jgi:8-oxo-dGTP pyrophosphatase MutT (NUDIX family)
VRGSPEQEVADDAVVQQPEVAVADGTLLGPYPASVLQVPADVLYPLDPDDGSYYYRPLGGGIDFSETGEEAARRELREELGVELGSVRFLGFLENLF